MKLSADDLERWFCIAASRLLKVPESAFSTPARAKRSLGGLKHGINDLLTMSEHSGRTAEADRALREAHLPTFDEMRGQLRRKEAAILRRGRIRSEEEYYIVKEVLSDADTTLRPASIRKLEAMMSAFRSGPVKE